MESTSEKRVLLETTKNNLNYIVACIFQVPTQSAADYLHRATDVLVSKMAAAGVSAGLFGLVSTFGVASTGVSIGALSGAAQTTATFYAVGSWVGGGVAAGTLLTGGIGVAAGVLVFHYLRSTPRTEDSLTDVDRRIINTAIFLTAQIDEEIERDREPSDEELTVFFNTVIEPFFTTLKREQDDIGARLDARNRWNLKVNGIIDFQREVVDGFRARIVNIGR